MTSRTDQLEAENGDYTNSGGGMDRAIQVMTEVAQTIAEQTMAKNERDIRKQQREERNAESKGLVDFRRHDPPQFLGETEPEKADLWLHPIGQRLTMHLTYSWEMLNIGGRELV
ncbi:hypothetical protein QL285_071751 [Trifolium repens]|jgi:hypothetical protein|nr:hypothetical protein QL285_071751 [Trifolium repens]